MKSNSDNMEYIVDLLLEDDDDGAMENILLEGEEEDIVRELGGETTLMNYLLKFEEYLDDHDIYLFDGWIEAMVVEPPKVDKFWVTIWLKTIPGTDLRGAKRLIGDKEGQNRISYKVLDEDEKGRKTHLVKFKILKRFLDQIEQRNKEKSDQLSDEELG